MASVIVADTNLIVYLLISGQFTERAAAVYSKDPQWVVPRLWRSEFRNVLGASMRRGMFDLAESGRIMGHAEQMVRDREFEVASPPGGGIGMPGLRLRVHHPGPGARGSAGYGGRSPAGEV